MDNAKKQKQNENPFSADAAEKAGDVAPQKANAAKHPQNKRESYDEGEDKTSDAAPPADGPNDEDLVNMNKELHNLMGM